MIRAVGVDQRAALERGGRRLCRRRSRHPLSSSPRGSATTCVVVSTVEQVRAASVRHSSASHARARTVDRRAGDRRLPRPPTAGRSASRRTGSSGSTRSWPGSDALSISKLACSPRPLVAGEAPAQAQSQPVIAVPQLPTPRERRDRRRADRRHRHRRSPQLIAADLRSSRAAIRWARTARSTSMPTEVTAPIYPQWREHRRQGARSPASSRRARRAAHRRLLRLRRQAAAASCRKGFVVDPERLAPRRAPMLRRLLHQRVTKRPGRFDSRIAYVAESGVAHAAGQAHRDHGLATAPTTAI